MVDHILVLNAMHPAGQHLVPVIHELDIVTVVIADAGKIVGKRLPAGEELFEAGETRAHRVTPGVDDPGVRKDQVNQADVAEVVRHLVDETRCFSPLYTGRFDIIPAQAP